MITLSTRLARLLVAAAALTLAITATSGAGHPASAGASILVNSTNHPGAGVCDLAECTLHEAITDANANAGQDTITFDPSVFPSGAPATIAVSVTALPASDDPDGVIIDGTGAGVIVDGSAFAGTEAGLVFHSATVGIDLTGVVVRAVTVQNFPGFGLHVCGGPIAGCDEDLSGTQLSNVNVLGNGDEGIEITGANVTNTTLADCDSSSNAGAGIRVRAIQQLDFTSVSACSANDNGSQGIQLRGDTGASNTTVSDVTVTGNNNDGIWLRSTGDITNVSFEEVTAAVNFNGTGVHIDATGSVASVSFSSITSIFNVTGIKIEGLNLTGIDISSTATNDNNSEGLLIDADGTISGTTISDCISNTNAKAGISIDSVGTTTDLTVTNCLLSGNDTQGVDLHGTGGVADVTFAGVTAIGNNNDGIHITSGSGGNARTTVTGTTVVNNASGIHLDAAGQTADASVTNNVATQNDTGIKLGGTGGITNASVESNTLMDNSRGIQVDGLAAVHFNRIVGNTVGVRQIGAGTLDAENNWWGCNGGPNTAGCDTTDGDADSDPWLILDLAADPASIPAFATSTLTADVTANSDGADTSGQGNIPNDIPITFTTDLGSVGSKQVSKPTTNGSAEATLTADEGRGTANVTATLDNETVADAVEITIATATPTSTPTPTAAPGQQVTWADHNCSQQVDPVDSLFVLRGDAGLSTNTGDCPEMGANIEVLDASPHIWGDVDCTGAMTPVDSLKVLRYDAGLSVTQEVDCPELGSVVTVSSGA